MHSFLFGVSYVFIAIAIQPFPKKKNLGTMASADFSRQALLRVLQSIYMRHTSVRPPRLRT